MDEEMVKFNASNAHETVVLVVLIVRELENRCLAPIDSLQANQGLTQTILGLLSFFFLLSISSVQVNISVVVATMISSLMLLLAITAL